MSYESLQSSLRSVNKRRHIYILLFTTIITICFVSGMSKNHTFSSFEIIKAALASIFGGFVVGVFVHYLRCLVISDESIAEQYGENFHGFFSLRGMWKQPYVIVIYFPVVFMITLAVGMLMKWVLFT